MHRGKAALAPVLVSLLLMSFAAVAVHPVQAQSTNWTSVISIRDLTGDQTLAPSAPLVAGHTYNATISVSVPVGPTNSIFNVSLNQALEPNGSQFWYLHTPGYAGYDRATFTSSLKQVTFNWKPGTLVLSAIFLVPVNLTTVTTSGVTLHFAKETFPLVTITSTGGIEGTVGVPVVDQSIQTYLSDYQTASTLVSSGKVSSTYSSLLKALLAETQSMYQAGLTTQASSILESLTPSTLPSPPSSSYVSYLVGALVLLAVLAAALAMVYVRGRGKIGYSEGIVNEISRELASLEVVAGRYDKGLADQLKTLRNRLEESS